MKNENLTYLCKISQLKDRFALKVEIKNSSDLAVVSIDGKISVFTNVCPHKSVSALADGAVIGDIVYCPRHNQGFNVFTGARLEGGAPISVYEPIIIGDEIFVEIIEKKPKWTEYNG